MTLSNSCNIKYKISAVVQVNKHLWINEIQAILIFMIKWSCRAHQFGRFKFTILKTGGRTNLQTNSTGTDLSLHWFFRYLHSKQHKIYLNITTYQIVVCMNALETIFIRTQSRIFPLPLDTMMRWWLLSEMNRRSPLSSAEMHPETKYLHHSFTTFWIRHYVIMKQWCTGRLYLGSKKVSSA